MKTYRKEHKKYYKNHKVKILKQLKKYQKLHKREILELCCTKKYLNYCELAYQVKNDVLTNNSYNGNILGRYFLKDMQNCKK